LVPTVSVKILGGVLTAKCDSGANTVTVDHVVKAGKGFAEINGQFFADTSYSSIRIYGGAGGTVSNIHSNVKPLTVFGDSAADVVNLGDASNKLQGIKRVVVVEDEAGFTATVNINDQGDTAARTVTVSTVPRAKDTSLGQVLGLGAAAIQWDYKDTAAVTVNLGVGASTVNVNGTGLLTTNISVTAPKATVNVGNGNVAANILGKLNLLTQASGATVGIGDNNDTHGQTATLATVSRLNQSSLGQLTGLGSGVITWDYLGTNTLAIVGGSGANTFNIQGTVVTTLVDSNGPATMNVGQGGSIAGIQGLLILGDTSGPNNIVNVNSQNDSGTATAFVSDQPAVGTLPPVGFLNVPGLANQVLWITSDTAVASLNLGAGTSTIDVLATSVATNVFSNTGATINVGSGGSVAGIQGALNLQNTADAVSIVNINDQNDSAATQTVTVSTIVGPGGTSLGAVNGLGAAQITWDYLNTSTVNLNLGHGASTVDVFGTGTTTNVVNSAAATINVGNSGSVGGIQSILNLANTAGALDTVNINDQNDTATRTVTVSTITGVGDALGAVNGLGTFTTITWDYFGTSAVTLNLGAGASTVDVLGTGVTTTIFNSGLATVNVGENGSVAGIQGVLNLANTAGALDTVNINDQNDTATQTVTVSTLGEFVDPKGAVNGLGAAAQITWDDFGTLAANLNLGAGASTVNVLGTGATTNIFNSANATINVGENGSVAGIQATLNLENELAFDTVNINSQDDSATQTVTLITVDRPVGSSLGAIDGLVGGAPITYDYLDTRALNLNLGTGASTVNVLATGVPTNIFNRADANINVGFEGSLEGILTGIQGALLLENEPAFDTIVIDDSTNTVGQFYDMTTIPGDESFGTFEQVTSSAFGPDGSITFDNRDTRNVQLLGGDGSNQFDIISTVVATQVGGGAGVNTFNVLPPGASGSLGASILGPLTLAGGGNPGSTLNLVDQRDPGSETFNFNVVGPGIGDLTLGSSPAFDLSFNGFDAGVNLFTNGASTVNDLGDTFGTVHVF
jgi:acrosin